MLLLRIDTIESYRARNGMPTRKTVLNELI